MAPQEPQKAVPSPKVANALRDAIDDFITETLYNYPHIATRVGMRTYKLPSGVDVHLDKELPNFSEGVVDARVEKLQEYQARLAEKVPEESLGPDDLMDLKLLRDVIKTELFDLSVRKIHISCSLLHASALAQAIYYPLEMDYASEEERMHDILDRMHWIPPYTERAIRMIQYSSDVYDEPAAVINQKTIELIDKEVPKRIGLHPELSEKYKNLKSAVLISLNDFQTFLEKDIKEKPQGKAIIGAENYGEYFETAFHGLVTPAEAEDIAQARIEKIKREMYELARPVYCERNEADRDTCGPTKAELEAARRAEEEKQAKEERRRELQEKKRAQAEERKRRLEENKRAKERRKQELTEQKKRKRTAEDYDEEESKEKQALDEAMKALQEAKGALEAAEQAKREAEKAKQEAEQAKKEAEKAKREAKKAKKKKLTKEEKAILDAEEELERAKKKLEDAKKAKEEKEQSSIKLLMPKDKWLARSGRAGDEPVDPVLLASLERRAGRDSGQSADARVVSDAPQPRQWALYAPGKRSKGRAGDDDEEEEDEEDSEEEEQVGEKTMDKVIAFAMAQIQKFKPGSANMVKQLSSQVEDAAQSTRKANLLTVSKTSGLTVKEMPVFLSATGGVFEFEYPPVFQPNKDSFLYVATEGPTAVLTNLTRTWLKFAAARYGTPGFYELYSAALAIQDQNKRVLRVLFPDAACAEGWALYSAIELAKNGDEDDGWKLKLVALLEELRAAVELLVDVGIHAEKMNENDAVSLLKEEAYANKKEAQNILTNVKLKPTRRAAPFLGLVFWQEVRGKAGDSAKDFHDEALSYGGVPVGDLAALLGNSTEE